jgi:hypothetical protein
MITRSPSAHISAVYSFQSRCLALISLRRPCGTWSTVLSMHDSITYLALTVTGLLSDSMKQSEINLEVTDALWPRRRSGQYR